MPLTGQHMQGERPAGRTCVSALIRSIGEKAKTPGEEGNLKSLRKLYLSAMTGAGSCAAPLAERAVEPFAVGWED